MNGSLLAIIVAAGIGIIYLIWKFFFEKKDNQNKSEDGVDTPSDEETTKPSGDAETISDKEIKKDEGTLSVPASGDTKQTEEELQLERSAPEPADNLSLETASMSDDGSMGEELDNNSGEAPVSPSIENKEK